MKELSLGSVVGHVSEGPNTIGTVAALGDAFLSLKKYWLAEEVIGRLWEM